MWCLLCTPFWGCGPQPRHVPWLRIEPVILWFAACAQSTELYQLEMNFFLCCLYFLFYFTYLCKLSQALCGKWRNEWFRYKTLRNNLFLLHYHFFFQGQPFVKQLTMVGLPHPCVQAFTSTVKVWRQGCAGPRWCVGYERR